MGATKIRELNNTDAMKLAEVIPFFKTGDEGSFSNYRPVSLLPL